MIYHIIPARRGSKRLPNKNNLLFDYTAQNCKFFDNVIVTTDDEHIKISAEKYGFIIHDRNEILCNDTASIKDVLVNVSKKFNPDDIIILLYLTYPQRRYIDIVNSLNFFLEKKYKSLLCRKEIKSVHPCLYMFADGDKGKQLFKHNLYRCQDYPEVFEISHYIGICYVSELKKLNKNLYNKDTVYFPVDDFIDIDTPEDYERFLNK